MVGILGENKMNELFSPQIRNSAIETTCSNLIMAGLLQPLEVARYMTHLTRMDNLHLAEQLCASRLLLDTYYETCFAVN